MLSTDIQRDEKPLKNHQSLHKVASNKRTRANSNNNALRGLDWISQVFLC